MSDWIREQFLIEFPNMWGAPDWAVPAFIAGGLLFLLILYSYRVIKAPLWLKSCCGLLKTFAILLLIATLVEPMRSDLKPTPGVNVFVILADQSQSLQLTDPGQSSSRADTLKATLNREQAWQVRLGQDFEVRRYQFDSQLSGVSDFDEYTAQGEGSSIVSSLNTIADRFRDRPTAGMLLFTDGNATDLAAADLSGTEIDWSQFPSVYPVVLGKEESGKDISVRRVTASQTNFEAAPVTIMAEVSASGIIGESVVIELLDEKSDVLQTEIINDVQNDQTFAVRFQVKPEQRGVLSYQVRAFRDAEQGVFEKPEKSTEATLLNNTRLVMVNRGRGPYKILYVSGRPNWEFKFLNRALAGDDEIIIHALIRIAKREPKFQFREKDSNANRIFTNTDDEKKEQVERYDEPVLLRVGKMNPGELSGGFPKTREELFNYHAVILDDLEAEFFTQDQKSLLQDFVSQRGGGFMMLGGMESFVDGEYHRTPIGEMLPVYLSGVRQSSGYDAYRLELTREGKLEPWIRVRSTEQEERLRLSEMPLLQTLNPVGALKPAASLLTIIRNSKSETAPALVTQRYGKGRTCALMIGDLWRWKLHQNAPDNEDLEKVWRQTARWLVGEVPQRVLVDSTRKLDNPIHPIEISIDVNDENYRPLDNADVKIEITPPDGEVVKLVASPNEAFSGKYTSNYVSRATGIYRAKVMTSNPDGSEISQSETGWISEPATDEFLTLKPNLEFLETIAEKTGGEIIKIDALEKFVRTLPDREIPVVEPEIHSIWHKWSVFLLAVGLLASEWGLRRWKGLA
ncbi:glutamine amidotransferase [Rubinisphaera italica]|uniref:Putative glutamine amidotransferase domain-containing protein n=1 Tax=Rubinisphaera italica TaxID=2527969 RepID=A0A5C5XBD4_9PLAN|nr:glutamine amidotransferase [Rubinisphaera italica]TWT60467.1 hypothetical protein Pan54_11810 [Rubinisphaera italica]